MVLGAKNNPDCRGEPVYLDHIAIWTTDLERLKSFYESYFDVQCGSLYFNPNRQFSSYFLSFEQGARLELMSIPELDASSRANIVRTGYAHLAIAVASKEKVDAITARLEKDGYDIVGAPRLTGDGYYESVVLDPDGNMIEITAG